MAGKRKTITWIVDENGCHICTSHPPQTYGYPMLWKDGAPQNMHHVLYEEKHGPLPKGVHARHTCDVRLCINMDHVIPGTHQDNMRDRNERGRHNPPIGERSGSSKLTTADVVAIRASTEPQKEVAQRYSITQQTVSDIRLRRRWRHVA